MLSKENHDTIVIGAGISGLLSALALSKEGKKVLVIEKNNFLGGNCRTYKMNGYSVDTGPHAITDLKTGPLVRLMDKYFSKRPEFIPVKSYYARDGEKLQEIPLTLPQFAMFDILSRTDRVLILGAMMDAVTFSAIDKKFLDKSIYDYIKNYGFSKKALRLTDTMSYFLSGRSMMETPMWRMLDGAGYMDETSIFPRFNKIKKIISNDYSSQGYPVGGIQSIQNCVLESMPENSVDIHSGEKLERIIAEGGRVSGVKTDKGEYCADTVIYSGFVKELPGFADCLESEYADSLGKIKQSQSLTLWLGLKEKLPELSYTGSEVYFDTDTPYWAMPVSNFDPNLAPEGKQLAGFSTVMKEKNPEKQLKKLKNVIFKAIPGIKEKIEFEHIQITIPEKAAVTVGVEFPSPRSPIKGLYLVGTDTDMRSMGLTRAAFSVVEALKFMTGDGVI